MTVFLGGTCNNSSWRELLIPNLQINYFNPVVEDWTPECMVEEIRQREVCDFCLYVITPKMTGVYSIAEAVDDSNKRPEKTIFCFLGSDGDILFTDSQLKSLNQVRNLITNNGAKTFETIEEVYSFLNNQS
jgi:hypothetical protein